jgi:hypothetical protein
MKIKKCSNVSPMHQEFKLNATKEKTPNLNCDHGMNI